MSKRYSEESKHCRNIYRQLICTVLGTEGGITTAASAAEAQAEVNALRNRLQQTEQQLRNSEQTMNELLEQALGNRIDNCEVLMQSLQRFLGTRLLRGMDGEGEGRRGTRVLTSCRVFSDSSEELILRTFVQHVHISFRACTRCKLTSNHRLTL